MIPLGALDVGTIGQWVAVLGVGIVAFLIYKGGGGAALATLETANRVLEKRVGELERQVREDAVVIAELRARTDVTVALTPLVTALHDHDANAEARSEKVLGVLQQIADHAGPERNGE